jgi:hypothetical protein
MDPSEIIAVPVPLDLLDRHVFFTMSVLLVAKPRILRKIDFSKEVRVQIMATALMLAVLILCGVHPLRDLPHTLRAALYLTTLAWPMGVLKGEEHDTFLNRCYQLVDLSIVPTTAGVNQAGLIIASHRFYGTMLGLIPFAILNILDWGLQIQRWPLPLVIGGTIGWTVGNLFSILPIRKLAYESVETTAGSSSIAKATTD